LQESGSGDAKTLAGELDDGRHGAEFQAQENGNADHSFVAHRGRINGPAILHKDHEANGTTLGKIDMRDRTTLPVNLIAVRQ
jgi:hypothetical protein